MKKFISVLLICACILSMSFIPSKDAYAAESSFAASSLIAKSIAGGFAHTVALKYDGTVWTWGENWVGQLGDGTNTDRKTPVQVKGLSGVKAIACGDRHTIALKEDGTVWTWGRNDYGQLGDGTDTNRSTPVQVPGLSGVKAIACGYKHTIALTEDGTVWTWGYNRFGQLGYETDKAWGYTPDPVPGLSRVKAIAGGIDHSVALKEDGTVWAWGLNDYGQLGDGTNIKRGNPVLVKGISGVKAIACEESDTVALKEDGTVWTWGNNMYGQLGYETDRLWGYTPDQVPGLSGVKAIAGGEAHTVALKEDGTVWTWGKNIFGQLGDGTETPRKTPLQVPGLSGVKTIAGGFAHTVALKYNGTVWTWGLNGSGQLGDGTETERHTPVQVIGSN